MIRHELSKEELLKVCGGIVQSVGTPPADKLLASGAFVLDAFGGITNGHVDFYDPRVVGGP